MKKLVLTLGVCLICASLTAQQSDTPSKGVNEMGTPLEKPEKVKESITYEQMTQKMNEELQLNEKQANKIAKLNKKFKTLIEGENEEEGDDRRPPMGQDGPRGGQGGPEGGMGGFGGGMGGPGGGMGGGFGGGMGGPGGGMGGGFGGGMGGPRGGFGGDMEDDENVSYDYDKQQEKYDKQMKKLLTEEQYKGYEKLKPQFASQQRIKNFLFEGKSLTGTPDGQGRPHHKGMPGKQGRPNGNGFGKTGANGNSNGRPMPPGGGHNGPKEGTQSETGIGISTGEQTVDGTEYTSEKADENAVQVKGGTLNLNECRILKSGGDSSNGDATSFYGVNSAVVATNGGTVNIQKGEITTTATGANGVVAYGGKVNISDATIRCTKNLSRGIHATGGGEINATNLDIETQGNNSSVIATDRGGGIVTVNGGNYKTSGKDCAVCYSTGTITVNGIKGESTQGEIGVIEGDNEININDCQMTSGDNRRGMMILQSGSGDAEGFNGRINVNGGSLTLTSSEAPLVEITTSTKGTVSLKDVALSVPSGILMRVDYNKRWNTTNPVAFLNLKTDSQTTYEGDIEVDSYGTSTVTIDKNVTWNGAYDAAHTGKSTTVVVNGTWNLTKDSYVDNVVVNDGGTINRNGFQLTTK